MKYLFISLLAYGCAISFLNAQNCNCDITLTGLSTTSLNLIWASQTTYAPGDTICIPAGNYAGIRFYDFEGTAANPLTIINCGGQVVLNETGYSAIELRGSKYIHLTGTGDANTTYGIKVNGTSSWGMGLDLSKFSSDIEVDHLEIANAGFAGIMAKTDPHCGDSNTWRSNGFIMKNLDIHHNYIHDTGGEGIYIGFSLGYKLDVGRTCNGVPIYGHWLENVDVHHNIVENTAWDAIQLNLVRTNGKVRDNYIYNYGTDGRWAQAYALSIGGGIYEIYNNYCENGPLKKGWGMQLINGDSGTKIFNNVIIDPKLHGIFLHPRHEFSDPQEGYYVSNNTIVTPERSGIHYNTTILHPIDPADLHNAQEEVPTYFTNNLIIDPGYDFENGNTWKGNQESYIDFNEKITRDSLLNNIYTNILTRQADSLGLTDIANHDYSPNTANSAVVDAATDHSVWGITFDLDNTARPSGNGFDIGAYEYLQTTNLSIRIPALTDDGANTATLFYPNPTNQSFRLVNTNFENSNMQVRSLDGTLFYSGIYHMGKAFTVTAFPSGHYVIQLFFKDRQETHRLVVP